MAIETELKLALPAEHEMRVRQWLDAHAQAAGVHQLHNQYYDTPAMDLLSAKAALRLRAQPGGWVQTLKTGGVSRDGLAFRHEWEMPVAAAALEAEPLLRAVEVVAVRDWLRPLLAQLQPVFRTDFQRNLWRVTPRPGCCIEVALDQGEVIVANSVGQAGQPESSLRLPIQEIELELKAGDAQDLQQLAAVLRQIAPLQPDDTSKAARGYQLLSQQHR